MIHLTLSGTNAGRSLCDCDKGQARARGDTFQPYMYADIHLPDICPACYALIVQAENEADAEHPDAADDAGEPD